MSFCQLNYGDFKFNFDTHKEHIEARGCKEYLEGQGFKFLSWGANEGLTITGAWLETESFAFCLTNAKPFVDDLNGVIFPDPFTCPLAINEPVCISIYEKPFMAGDPYPGEEPEKWVMDGSPPSATHDANCEREVIAKDCTAAVEHILWLRHLASK